jgi:hypothetical protein
MHGAINTPFLPLRRSAAHGVKKREISDFFSPKEREKHQIL